MNTKKTTQEIEASHQQQKSALPAVRTTVVVLDNLRSGLNIGNIFRSSDAFGIQHIYCTGYTVTPPHREVLKSALGATETVAWSHQEDPVALIRRLKTEGYYCVAIEQTANSCLLNEWSERPEKMALLFGNEVEGVNQELINLCDLSVELPQRGMKHSLNVAVCAGIVLYDIQMA
jgi:23S rRNA (guanosine2251-2'-O)-methyltransferase